MASRSAFAFAAALACALPFCALLLTVDGSRNATSVASEEAYLSEAVAKQAQTIDAWQGTFFGTVNYAVQTQALVEQFSSDPLGKNGLRILADKEGNLWAHPEKAVLKFDGDTPPPSSPIRFGPFANRMTPLLLPPFPVITQPT